MSFWSDFKDFALKGNVLDMAIGIILGVEFGKVVNSLVNDIIMPPLGYAISGVNFKELQILIKAGNPAEKLEPVAVKYGLFIQNGINFLIIAASIFLMLRVMYMLQGKKMPKKEAK